MKHAEGTVKARSDWLGPAPWSVMRRAAARAGLILEEGRGEGVAGTFTDGWLRLEEADHEAVGALQMALARLGGRSVQRWIWAAAARSASGRIMVEGRVEGAIVSPEGRLLQEPAQNVSVPVEVDAEAVSSLAMRELLDETEGAAVKLARVLDGPLAHLHPELAWRDLHLRVPEDWVQPSGTMVEVDGVMMADAAVARMLTSVGRRLDSGSRAPDLDRWTWRAVRRAGLDKPPKPGDPDWPKYHTTWLELSEQDRSLPGADGKVAAWRFRSPGEWIVPPAECAILADVVHEEACREVFRRGAAGAGCPVTCRTDEASCEPWRLDPVALHVEGERLTVLLGDRVLVEAERAEGEIRVLRAEGITAETAISHLRAALQRA